MSPVTISDNISAASPNSGENGGDPQSPTERDPIIDPGDLAAALLDQPIDTQSLNEAANESCV